MKRLSAIVIAISGVLAIQSHSPHLDEQKSYRTIASEEEQVEEKSEEKSEQEQESQDSQEEQQEVSQQEQLKKYQEQVCQQKDRIQNLETKLEQLLEDKKDVVEEMDKKIAALEKRENQDMNYPSPSYGYGMGMSHNYPLYAPEVVESQPEKQESFEKRFEYLKLYNYQMMQNQLGQSYNDISLNPSVGQRPAGQTIVNHYHFGKSFSQPSPQQQNQRPQIPGFETQSQIVPTYRDRGPAQKGSFQRSHSPSLFQGDFEFSQRPQFN